MKPTMRFASLLALLLTTGALHAATYRWVDSQGRVHYGDVIPSQESGLGNVELDSQGRVKKENPRTRLSPEERRRQEAERMRAEETRRRSENETRRDRALLTTYVSEEEIDLARDRTLDQELSNVRGLKVRIQSANEKLAYANEQVSQYTKSGKNVPGTYIQMRNEAHAELNQLENLLRQREQAMEDIKARYEADKLRFRELKAELTSRQSR